MAGGETVDTPLVAKDQRLFCATQPRCSSNNPIEHGLKLEFRAADGAQHVCQCCLLSARFLQFLRARHLAAGSLLSFWFVETLGRSRLAWRFWLFDVFVHHTFVRQAVAKRGFAISLLGDGLMIGMISS